MRFIDTTGMGSMTELGSRDGLQRSFGSYALYGAGKMMVAGGAVPAVKSTVLIDLNGSTPVVTPGPSMLRERRHMNLTVMADGSLLAVGGYWGDEPLDVASPNSVLIPERWDPATNQWSDLAPLQRGRGYHSVSILLPDGRVAVGGSGMPFTIPGNQLNMEVFSPPYLFEASTAPSATGNYFWQGAKTGNVSCSDATFGDPNSSVAKSCSYVTATVRAKALPAGTTTCASEGGTCTLPAGTFATVYYGGGTGFLARPGQTGAVACSDANFGNPAATATKGCAYTTANPGLVTQAVLPVGTTICAAENASCTVPAGSIATVYYGANGAHSARGNLTGAVACTNANFGDPIYGTAKSCSLHITSTTTSGSAAQLPPGAIGCAAQNGVCALPGGVAARVYYGAGGDVATGGTGGGQLAARPSIAYAPESVGYGGSFIVKQGPGHTISKAHLIKLGAVTHAQDQGQRLVPLSFTANGSDLQVTAPTNPNIAPPGYYMLFIVNNKGVPSVAKMVQVQQHAVVSVLSRASDKAIEVVPGVNGNGTTVQIKGDAALPDVNKSWDMVPTDGGYFKLVSRATGLALSVPAGSTQDGARVEAIADVNGPHQQWKFTRTTLGYFTIKARHVDKGLRVAGRSTADGAALEQGALGSTLRTSEEWVLMPVGYQRITGVQSGKVAEVVGRSSADGAAVAIAP
ncbi:MAG TPA: galactose oxidase-like domain-containing protein, partial [Rubrivivax sp.]|nr:galactose oxidase-like domain-containing protein [Rubrivivax sp.]